jgi:hypothetical protein
MYQYAIGKGGDIIKVGGCRRVSKERRSSQSLK